MISAIISAIIVGLIIGALGRLVVRGRQDMGLFSTFVIGVVAALIGSAIAGILGVSNTRESTGSSSSSRSRSPPSASRSTPVTRSAGNSRSAEAAPRSWAASSRAPGRRSWW